MRPSQALKAELRRLETRSVRGFKELRAGEVAHGPGRRAVTAEALALPQALNDRLLGQHAREALVVAYSAAHGHGDGALCECFGCRGRWSQDRTPGAFVKVTLTRPDAMLLALLCWECSTATPAEFQRIVTDGMKRDFLGGEGTVQTLAPAGRA